MGHHVDHGAVGGHLVADEDPQDHEAEVAHGGVGDEPVEVVLGDGGQAAVDDGDDRQNQDHRGGPAGGLREDRQDQGDHAEGADLVQDADEQHRGAGGGLLSGVGQPGVDRDQGRLDGEGDEEGQEDPVPGGRGDVQVGDHRVDEEAGGAVLHGVQVDRDDADEHDEPAGQGVQKELQSGALTPLAAEAADEEVHRDEHRLEAQVEQQQVTGREDDDDEELQGQDEPGEQPLPVGGDLAPGGEQDQGRDEGGQEEHGQTQAVDAQGPGGADGGDPRAGVSQLDDAGVAEVEGAQRPQAQSKDGQGEHEAHGAGVEPAQRWDQPQQERPGQWHDRHDGQDGQRCGKSRHVSCPLRTWRPGRR